MHDHMQTPLGRPRHLATESPAIELYTQMGEAEELDAVIRRNLEVLDYGA